MILNWLRSAHVPLLQPQEVEEILVETDYYQLTNLAAGIVAKNQGRCDFSSQADMFQFFGALKNKICVGIGFAGRDLRGLDLRGFDFRGCNFYQARLAGCKLHCADFSGANLNEADFSGCNLSSTEFANASMRLTDLSNAMFDLDYEIDFDEADVKMHDARFGSTHNDMGHQIRAEFNALHEGVDFTGAIMNGTTFRYYSVTSLFRSNADLSTAKGSELNFPVHDGCNRFLTCKHVIKNGDFYCQVNDRTVHFELDDTGVVRERQAGAE